MMSTTRPLPTRRLDCGCVDHYSDYDGRTVGTTPCPTHTPDDEPWTHNVYGVKRPCAGDHCFYCLTDD